MIKKTNSIAFRGELGASSDLACRDVFPSLAPVPCPTFESVFAAVAGGDADVAMVPIENTVSGRVSDIHLLLREWRLHIIGEHFMPIKFHLMALPGVGLNEIKTVHWEPNSLDQCRMVSRQNGWKPLATGDSAESAKLISGGRNRSAAVLASRLSSEIYGLDILRENIGAGQENITRFVFLSRRPLEPSRSNVGPKVLTTFMFNVRNIPAALYKALGGFATRGINITRLESYNIDGRFVASEFYVDIEGHPDDQGVKDALAELNFFSTEVRILGTYAAHPVRDTAPKVISTDGKLRIAGRLDCSV